MLQFWELYKYPLTVLTKQASDNGDKWQLLNLQRSWSSVCAQIPYSANHQFYSEQVTLLTSDLAENLWHCRFTMHIKKKKKVQPHFIHCPQRIIKFCYMAIFLRPVISPINYLPVQFLCTKHSHTKGYRRFLS